MTTTTGAPRTALMERLVNKAGGVRSEATIQSDVRMLLLDPELGLAEDDLEVSWRPKSVRAVGLTSRLAAP